MLPNANSGHSQQIIVTNRPIPITELITITMPIPITEPITITMPIPIPELITITKLIPIIEPITINKLIPIPITEPITITEPILKIGWVLRNGVSSLQNRVPMMFGNCQKEMSLGKSRTI